MRKQVPRGYKTVEVLVEFWDCPKCGGTLFRKEDFWQIRKREGDQVPRLDSGGCCGGYRIICVNCGNILHEFHFLTVFPHGD